MDSVIYPVPGTLSKLDKSFLKAPALSAFSLLLWSWREQPPALPSSPSNPGLPTPNSPQPEAAPHLDVAMGSCNDVDALAALLVLQDAGVVLGCQDEQQVLALPLETRMMLSKEVLFKTDIPGQPVSVIL